MKKCIIKNCIHCKKKNKRYICVKYSFENLNKDTICFEDVENKMWQNVIVSVDKKIWNIQEIKNEKIRLE